MNSAEIAKLANVSRATVSRVLNGHSNVSASTKEKIERIMREHNYFPDEAARKLAGKSNQMIALFVIDFSSKPGEYTVTRSPFFSEFAGYAIDIANIHGYNLVTTIIHKENLSDIDRLFQSKSIAGGIIMGDILDQGFLANLSSQGYKLVLCHQIRHSPSPNILVVGLDNYKCGRLAGEELIRNGHTRIAHITGERHRIAVQDRLEGFINALTAAGLSFDKEHYLEYGEFYCNHSDYEATLRLLQRNLYCLPTAIFISSVLMQVGVMKALRDFGLRVPADISLICLDEVSADIYTDPPISVVSFSNEKYAKLAVTKLIELINCGSLPIHDYTISDCNVIRRESILDISKAGTNENSNTKIK